MLAKTLASVALLGFGTLVHAQSCPVGGDASIVAMAGTSVGTEQVVDGSKSRWSVRGPKCSRKLTKICLVTMYVTKPNASAPVTNTALLYLTDVFGINLTENRL